jgi:hypothetical protein
MDDLFDSWNSIICRRGKEIACIYVQMKKRHLCAGTTENATFEHTQMYRSRC